MDYTTVTRTFIGQPETRFFDGYAGFRIGQTYQLRYRTAEDGTVKIAMDHVGQPLAEVGVTAELFEEWWVE